MQRIIVFSLISLLFSISSIFVIHYNIHYGIGKREGSLTTTYVKDSISHYQHQLKDDGPYLICTYGTGYPGYPGHEIFMYYYHYDNSYICFPDYISMFLLFLDKFLYVIAFVSSISLTISIYSLHINEFINKKED
jgi:hypothetical protein